MVLTFKQVINYESIESTHIMTILSNLWLRLFTQINEITATGHRIGFLAQNLSKSMNDSNAYFAPMDDCNK